MLNLHPKPLYTRYSFNRNYNGYITSNLAVIIVLLSVIIVYLSYYSFLCPVTQLVGPRGLEPRT